MVWFGLVEISTVYIAVLGEAKYMVWFFTSYKKDNVDTIVLQETVYPFTTLNNSGVSDTATFTENTDGTTYILIELEGSNTSEHPAFIRYNTYQENGANAITVKNCTCLISETVVTKLDGGTSINYDGLLKFDGHVAILTSKDDDTVVAVSNIAKNATKIN